MVHCPSFLLIRISAKARMQKSMPKQENTQPAQIISRRRVVDHGEVFTAEREVRAMCDLVGQECERIASRFLEPACGQGAFLVEILNRKLAVVAARYPRPQIVWEQYACLAVSSLYGVEILPDNVAVCRRRLFEVFDAAYTSLFGDGCKEACRRTVRRMLELNIVWGDALTLKTLDDAQKPIVFAEWSDTGKGLFKRRDFTLANLLESQPMEGPNLFSDLGEQAFLPTPVAEYPLVHFLKIGEP